MNFKRAISLVICVFFLFSSMGVLAEETVDAQAEKTPVLTDGEMAKILVEQSANLIISRYKYDVTREELYEKTLMKLMESHPELIEDAFEGMFSDLDKHTVYYTEEEFNYFLDSMAGEFCGIGVTISVIPQGILVNATTKESSAGQAGIQQGDIIISADGVNLVGMSIEQARTYIIGDIDTTVTVGIMRNGEYLEFTVVRRPVVVEPGSYDVIDGTIGYIELQSFDESAPILVNNALDYFDSLGITDIIFDLRYNSGGSVNALVQLSQRIIPKGPIIHFEYKNELQNSTLYSYCPNPKYSLIVLANDYSASASEAFCGAVQDSGIGIVVGSTTYGKGTMQNLTNFKVGGGVKMTEAEYLTRNKRHIDDVGIKPDYRAEDKIIRMKKAGFNDFDFETKLKLGDEGPLVLALNQRLDAMGYDVGIPDDKFTEDTYNAVYSFQSLKQLYPYGVCDITTQVAIQTEMQTLEFSDNNSLKTAIEIFKSGTLSNYIK